MLFYVVCTIEVSQQTQHQHDVMTKASDLMVFFFQDYLFPIQLIFSCFIFVKRTKHLPSFVIDFVGRMKVNTLFLCVQKDSLENNPALDPIFIQVLDSNGGLPLSLLILCLNTYSCMLQCG